MLPDGLVPRLKRKKQKLDMSTFAEKKTPIKTYLFGFHWNCTWFACWRSSTSSTATRFSRFQAESVQSGLASAAAFRPAGVCGAGCWRSIQRSGLWWRSFETWTLLQWNLKTEHFIWKGKDTFILFKGRNLEDADVSIVALLNTAEIGSFPNELLSIW